MWLYQKHTNNAKPIADMPHDTRYNSAAAREQIKQLTNWIDSI